MKGEQDSVHSSHSAKKDPHEISLSLPDMEEYKNLVEEICRLRCKLLNGECGKSPVQRTLAIITGTPVSNQDILLYEESSRQLQEYRARLPQLLKKCPQWFQDQIEEQHRDEEESAKRWDDVMGPISGEG